MDFDFGARIYGLTILNWTSVFFFLSLWIGYTLYAKNQIGKRPCLAGELRYQRDLWMVSLLLRENRIADVNIIANVERYVMFYTSSTLLLMASVLAAMTNAEALSAITAQIPLLKHNQSIDWTYKFLLLLIIFTYTFFKFTWSVREYGFASILIGSSPLPNQIHSEQERRQFAQGMAHLLDRASEDFNAGMRAYYFALTIIAWLFSPLLFALAVCLVVIVLYRREFRSESLSALVELRGEELSGFFHDVGSIILPEKIMKKKH